MKLFNYEEINSIYELSGNQWQCVLAGGVALMRNGQQVEIRPKKINDKLLYSVEVK